MPTLCVSVLLCSQQMVQSGTSFRRAIHCSTARHNHLKEPVAPSIARIDIPKFFSLRLPEAASVQEKKPRTAQDLKGNIRMELANI